MKKKVISRYFKLGLLVLVCIFLVYFGLNFLKGISIFSSDYTFYTQLDKVDGLSETAPINLKGYKVGFISKIKYEPQNEHPFTITLLVSQKTKLPNTTKVEVYDDGLLGSKAVRLVVNEKDIASGNFFNGNDTIPSFVTGGLFDVIQNEVLANVGNVLMQADSLMKSLRALTDNPALKNSLSSFEKASADLALSSTQLNKMMNTEVPTLLNNANVIVSDFTKVSGNLKNINFQATVDSLNTTISNLNQITENMNSKEGSLGLLMNDKQLYINLQEASTNANNLLIDLKANPKRYVHFSVFGRKN